MELVDREHLLVNVASLKQSPWFNRGKNEQYLHSVYLERQEAVETVEDLCIKSEPTVEAIPKDQYEARLKADMVAMLEDLDLQIDESAAYNLEVAKVQRLIRDKIDKLKEDKK